MRPLLICLIGPTAVGKTEVSVELARQLKTEIISCDSRQMYKELSIGTAVPSPSQLQSVKHHFIQHLSVQDYYSVYEYELDALKRLNHLFKTHEKVVLTGGSGLYLNALLYGMDDIPDPDPQIRISLEKRWQEEGLEQLRKELEQCDPAYYHEIDIHNPKRVLRGLEVALSTGRPFSSFRVRKARPRPFDHRIICLDRERDALYARINQRVDSMFEQGLWDEASRLYPLRHLNALRTVGYREVFSALDGLISREEACDLIKRNTRKYARKQLTWNRKYPDALWMDAGDENKLLSKLIRLAQAE